MTDIEKIVSHLEEATEIHQQLIELGEQKQKAIIGNDAKQLPEINNEENQCLKNIQQLEQGWQEAASQYFRQKSLTPPAEMTLSELARWVFHPGEKQLLLEARDRLLEKVGALGRLNEHNQQLIEQSLQFVGFSLELYTGEHQQEMLYQNPGRQMHKREYGGIFDSRA